MFQRHNMHYSSECVTLWSNCGCWMCAHKVYSPFDKSRYTPIRHKSYFSCSVTSVSLQQFGVEHWNERWRCVYVRHSFLKCKITYLTRFFPASASLPIDSLCVAPRPCTVAPIPVNECAVEVVVAPSFLFPQSSAIYLVRFARCAHARLFNVSLMCCLCVGSWIESKCLMLYVPDELQSVANTAIMANGNVVSVEK